MSYNNKRTTPPTRLDEENNKVANTYPLKIEKQNYHRGYREILNFLQISYIIPYNCILNCGIFVCLSC